MIQLTDIHYRYPGISEGWILDGINLSIREREYVLICGASGCGKSTLAYLFNGLIPHFYEGTLSGTVKVNGLDTQGMSVSDFLTEVGLVLQNADAQLFNSTVESEIAYGLESLGMPINEIDQKIKWTAETLHIEDLLNRSPETLSGGEKRLVAIASVLCLNPPVLVLDEPFAHLDWEGARRVRESLMEIHRKGKTVVVIEQHVDAILQDVTRCVIMEQGKIIFDGDPSDTRSTLLDQHLIPRYSPKKDRKRPDMRSVLAARKITFTAGGKKILNNVFLDLRSGEIVAFVGKNGAGKTTLIKHFNGLLRASEGKVIFMDKGILGRDPSQLASRVGVSFQNPNDQFFKNRVEDELMAGPRAIREKAEVWIEEISTIFDLHKLLDQSPYRLSEGQKKRVAFASVFSMRPKVIVLDEPTAGQDGRFLESLAGLLFSLAEHGFTIVIVTHDLEFAQAVADRWVVLHRGEVVGDGSPLDLLCDEKLIQMGAISKRELECNHSRKNG